MFDKNFAIVRLMLETIIKINRYTVDLNSAEEFDNDEKSFDAVLMNFIVLGESVSKLSEKFKSQNNEIEWRKISSFRNVLAHDYFGVLDDEVWEIIKVYLSQLEQELEGLK